jgi:hypothetical protein
MDGNTLQLKESFAENTKRVAHPEVFIPGWALPYRADYFQQLRWSLIHCFMEPV